jgi:monovalent cation:H+ antiporter-2, CPA2 family
VEGSHDFLVTFALVLGTAAITTVVFERLKLPVILGYLLAGLLVGPHVTFVPVEADRATTQTLSELGVILLLFAIGLEFSIRRLLRVGGAVGITAVFDISLMAWLGYGAATMLGWSPREALFAGAMVAISSTTIIAKTFEDRKVPRKLRDLVFGVLIVEDLAAVLFMAGLATLASSDAAATPLWSTMLRLVVLLVVWVIGGLLVVPRLMRFVIGLGRDETTLVASLGLCVGFALFAQTLGYSVALGAFIAGSLISESGKARAVEHLVQPVRDVFAAVFFVSVGMLIDPGVIAEQWVAVVVLTVLVIVGKTVAVSIGAFLAGQGTRGAVRAGLSMAQIGEFSFIIAGLGLATDSVRDFLYAVAVAVSAVTTLSTPFLVGWSEGIAAWVDRKLPKPLQTYATLYATWVEDLGKVHRDRTAGDRIRTMIRWLLVDLVLLTAITIGMVVAGPEARAWFVGLGLPPTLATLGMYGTVVLLGLPFALGIVRVAQALAEHLAYVALPKAGRLDYAAAPRRTLVASLRLVIVFVLGLPFLAVTQPFLEDFRAALLLGALLMILAVAGWRSATNLEGHVKAGAEVLLSALRHSLPPEQQTMEMPTSLLTTANMPVADRLVTATHLLPGMGTPEPFAIEAAHHAAGRTIGELGIRGQTGATILAITRGDDGIPAPSKLERLEAGDLILLVGSRTALSQAKQLLRTGRSEQ